MRYREFHYQWEWLFQSTPEQLWPFVSDTNQFNRDVGLPSVQPAGGEPAENHRRWLRFSRMGINVEWEEQPFEWVRPHRFGVVRRYRTGPVAMLRVRVALTGLPNGGTRLRYESWVQPRNVLGLAILPPFMASNRRAFGKAFRTYDRLIAEERSELDQPPAARFPSGGRERLAMLRERLAAPPAEAAMVARLCETVEKASAASLARLRPYRLADSWGAPRRKVLELCLTATRNGLFDLQWDILCPACRGPKQSAPTLADVEQQVHCETCNIDFGASFDRNVELTFRVNRSVRLVEDREFCIGGPQVTPHVVAQQLLAPSERRGVAVQLEPGRYRLRTAKLAGGQSVVATEDGVADATLTANNSGWPPDELYVSLTPLLHFQNLTDSEQLFTLERTAWTDQAVTAAEVTNLQTFRDLFSNEVLRPGEQISVGTLTVLFTDLRDSTRLYQQIGDAPAFGRVQDHFAVLRKAVVAADGALVKTIGDAVMAVFPRPVAGLRAVLDAQRQLVSPQSSAPPLYIKVGMHFGPCIAVTLNGRLDYFGSTVNIAARLERLSSGVDVIVSDAVHTDPEVAEFLSDAKNGLAAERITASLKGFDQEFAAWRIHRWQASA